MTTFSQGISLPAQGGAFGTAKLSGFVLGHPDDRPALVLLHGLTFDHRMWGPAIEALLAQDPGRQILALDLPGHGGSPMLPACDLEDAAAAVASAVEDAGLKAPVIVGHSIAAIIATIYATRYPTRGVVNVDQALDTTFVRTLQNNRDVVTGPGFAHMWSALLASMQIDALPVAAQQLLSTELPRQSVVLAYWRQPLEVPLDDLNAKFQVAIDALRHQQVPYTIVAGHEYEPAYAAWLQEGLPQATVTVVPNSGHFPHLADPDRFAELLARTGTWQGTASSLF